MDGECKWSSLLYFENQIGNSTMYLKPSPGFSIFTSNFKLKNELEILISVFFPY